MSSGTPERAFALFDAAVELPPAERVAFLDEACGADLALRAEVGRMLEADAAAHPLLDQTPAALRDAGHDAGTAETERRRVGPYRIVRELGRGGMGVVYLAEREDVGKQVALKLVRGALAAPERVERFGTERRILARLEHPHIAALFDAGVLVDGTPWFAMERVDGEPIDRYCDARRLDVAQRLALFEQVCDAVAYTHRNLIVHRDLKPSNILIAADGTPKLLDFGVAKLLDDYDERVTATGVRLLTPEYAAPEQLAGEPVTTATDLYQLGLILYELLCGQRPHRVASRTPGELERLVLGSDPPRPSLAVLRTAEWRDSGGSTESVLPARIAASRATLPGQLRRRLEGDLDAIVMRALAREPERRYPSVDALRDDLQRHRHGLPVRARPDTRRYRARAFVRRNRLAVAAAGLALLVIVGFAAAMTAQQARTARERDRAEAALVRAHTEAEKADEVTEFLTGLFTASDPYAASSTASGAEISARELLERGAERVDRLATQPEVQAKMLDAIGRAYLGLGRHEPARRLHERALSIRRQLHPGADADVANSLFRLGEVLGQARALDSAAVLHRQALDMRRHLWGDRHAEVARSLVALGVLAMMRGEPAQAEGLYLQALDVHRSLSAPDSADLAGTFNNLAIAATAQGRFASAESGFREALAINRVLYARDHPLVGQALSNLGGVLFEQNKLDEAEAILRQALAAQRAALGPDHPATAPPLGYLGRLALDQGRYGEAEALFRESLAIRRASYGPRHGLVAGTLVQLGSSYLRRGDHRTADSLYRDAYAIHREHLPEDHYLLAEVLSARAAALLAAERPAEAEPLARRAHEVLVSTWGETNPLAAAASRHLGEALTGLGRYGEAEPLLLAAHEAFRVARGADAWDTRAATHALAALYEAWGRPAQAARVLSEAAGAR